MMNLETFSNENGNKKSNKEQPKKQTHKKKELEQLKKTKDKLLW